MTTEAGKRHRTLLRWRGDVPCQTCGKPHDYRWTGYRATLSTWADPVDGHSYIQMNAAEAVAAERARITTGTPMRVIADTLGHSSPAITARVYAHVVPSLAVEAAERLDAALRRTSG